MAERDRKTASARGKEPGESARLKQASAAPRRPRQVSVFLDMGCPLARRYTDAARLPAWDNLAERRHT